MKYTEAFWRDDELGLARKFSEDGYIALPAENREALDCIRDGCEHRLFVLEAARA